jgi:1,4-alpha-glucan branching enzyme
VDKENNITYREWAPNATHAFLFGEFSTSRLSARSDARMLTIWTIDNWNRDSHPMSKNQYGVFEIVIPAKVNGQAAIPHNSKIKVHASALSFL